MSQPRLVGFLDKVLVNLVSAPLKSFHADFIVGWPRSRRDVELAPVSLQIEPDQVSMWSVSIANAVQMQLVLC